jgi:Nucleotidyltransferase/DNA polymerase involved in DNA repair
MIGVVDCNNFFVSCERVFAPKLIGRPAVVLSSNDGCVVARSNEAKAMGIAMGIPFFKVKGLVESGQLCALSSNYTLYGDMSRRVMSVIRRHVPEMEQYSIDECFIVLPEIEDYQAFGCRLSQIVEQWTGIPVSVGLAPTKTLAKLASRFAKKHKGYRGCCLIDTQEKRRKALELTNLHDVWGIGRKSAAKLEQMGLHTAWQFARSGQKQIRKLMGIAGEETWRELNGESVLGLTIPTARKSIQSTRSFNRPLLTTRELHTALADFCAQVAEKLRKENACARTVGIFFATDRFNPNVPFIQRTAIHSFDVATADPREFSAATRRLLEGIYTDGIPTKRAGVWVDGIEHAAIQRGLFDRVDRERQKRLLQTIDSVKLKMGRDSLRLASQEHVESIVSSELRSPSYSTKLSDILRVK